MLQMRSECVRGKCLRANKYDSLLRNVIVRFLFKLNVLTSAALNREKFWQFIVCGRKTMRLDAYISRMRSRILCEKRQRSPKLPPPCIRMTSFGFTAVLSDLYLNMLSSLRVKLKFKPNSLMSCFSPSLYNFKVCFNAIFGT